MAARKNLAHSPLTRERIKTGMLVNRLTLFVEGKVELSKNQVAAALGLLKKVIPDLQSVEMTGDESKPIHVTQSTRIIKREGDASN